MEHKTYDLLITDLQMPELNGEETVKIIRNDQNNHHLNIVVVGGDLTFYNINSQPTSCRFLIFSHHIFACISHCFYYFIQRHLVLTISE